MKTEYWSTIDYMGGGYVLQVRMDAKLNDDNTSIEDISPSLKVTETDKYETSEFYGGSFQTVEKTRITGLAEEHRIVHVSELEGIDTSELAADMAERFGDEMFES